MSYWHGPRPRREASALGCVGCGWALMLLFAIGAASVGCLLAPALGMAVEKNPVWGRALP